MDDRKRILKQLKMGTTEILILALLSQGDRYGYDISREVAGRSDGFFNFKQGFLYPTLRRMELEALIQAYWQKSNSGGPNRKYYRLSTKGRERLRYSLASWREFNLRFDALLTNLHPESAR